MNQDIVQQIREACEWVAAGAQQVRIDRDAIAPYAAALPKKAAASGERAALSEAERERLAAHWLTLDAINFGSGWFPTLRKRDGRSGYHTIALGISEQFERSGAWSAQELAAIGATEIAAALHQDREHELMELFACSLRDLGAHLIDQHHGRFGGLLAQANGSAVELVQLLAGWDCFGDTSTYRGRIVPFLKRAQIAAADLHRAGAARFGDIGRLTMFADNLVPHVLRLDGVLEFTPELLASIEQEELIAHGAPPEVEIRACAVHAVELLVQTRPDLRAADVDEVLWERGGEPRYKASPRHRSRCTAY
ncbi:MAG: queuosine salvage family protein [Solirubrobacteraceae bacterium]